MGRRSRVQVTKELIDACRRGEPGAFDDLVHQTHRGVFTLVARIVGDWDEAADITQEVYVRVWKGVRRFRGDAAFSTWLYRIAANTALSYMKRRNRSGAPTDPTELPDEPVADATEGQADADLLERALRRLPEEARTAVVLKDVYGWSCEEIAAMMGSTEGAIKVRLFRARQRLAIELATEGVVVPIRNKKRSS